MFLLLVKKHKTNWAKTFKKRPNKNFKKIIKFLKKQANKYVKIKILINFLKFLIKLIWFSFYILLGFYLIEFYWVYIHLSATVCSFLRIRINGITDFEDIGFEPEESIIEFFELFIYLIQSFYNLIVFELLGNWLNIKFLKDSLFLFVNILLNTLNTILIYFDYLLNYLFVTTKPMLLLIILGLINFFVKNIFYQNLIFSKIFNNINLYFFNINKKNIFNFININSSFKIFFLNN